MSGEIGGLDRVAANERLFLRLAKTQRGVLPVELACECTGHDCDQRIAIAPTHYQPVRVSAARYVVCPDDEHVDAEADCVVDRQPLYWVVEREPSVEMIAFYGSRERPVTSELSIPAPEARQASQIDTPCISAVPTDDEGR